MIGFLFYLFWCNLDESYYLHCYKTIDLEDIDLKGVKKIILEKGIISIPSYTFAYMENLFSFDASKTGLQSIGIAAFYNCKDLSSISLPSTVQAIGWHTFEKCIALESADLSHTSIVSIGAYTFYGCINLKQIKLPNSLSHIGQFAFYYCTSLNLNELPSEVNSIEYCAFEGSPISITNLASIHKIGMRAFFNTSITNLNTGDYIKIIPPEAFSYNQKLQTLKLGSNVERIEKGAFDNCILDSIEIPAKVMFIGDSAFNNNKISSLIFRNQNLSYIGEAAFTKLSVKSIDFPHSYQNILIGTFYSASIDNLIIPATIKSIRGKAFSESNIKNIHFEQRTDPIFLGDHSFAYNSLLETIELPNNISSFASAFYCSKDLKTVIVPDSIENISDFAFYGCSSLKNIQKMSGHFNTIGIAAFESCSIENISQFVSMSVVKKNAFCGNPVKYFDLLNTNITEIGHHAFDFEFKTENFVLPNTLVRIGEEIFGSKIEFVTLSYNGNLMQEISDSSFRESNIANVNISKSEIKRIGHFSFYKSKLSQIYLPNTTRILGCSCFCSSSLKKIDGLEHINEIDSFAFSGTKADIDFSKLTNLSLAGYKSFEGYDNFGCSNPILSEMGTMIRGTTENIKYLLDVVPDYCFYQCSKLKVDFEKNITIKSYAFSCCTGLTIDFQKIICIEDHAFQKTSLSNGDLKFNSENITICDYAFDSCETLSSLHFQGEIAQLGKSAFANAGKSFSITFNSTITEIQESCFYKSTCMSIDFGNKSISIGKYAFYGCTHINAVIFNDNIIAFNESVFESSSLSNGNFPEQLTTIGPRAFAYSKLSSVNLSPNVISIEDHAFEGSQSLETINISMANFIGEGVFKECYSLTSFTFPNSQTFIPDYCYYSTPIDNITIPSSVEIIGSYAFSHCSKLTNITFQSSNIEIREYAFSYSDLKYLIEVPFHNGIIPEGCFKCTNIKSINVGNNIYKIDNFAFHSCKSLEEFNFSENLSIIGHDAFYASKLSNIILPDNVTSIGSNAFSKCFYLKFISIPQNLTYVDDCFLIRSLQLERSLIKCNFENFAVPLLKDEENKYFSPDQLWKERYGSPSEPFTQKVGNMGDHFVELCPILFLSFLLYA